MRNITTKEEAERLMKAGLKRETSSMISWVSGLVTFRQNDSHLDKKGAEPVWNLSDLLYILPEETTFPTEDENHETTGTLEITCERNGEYRMWHVRYVDKRDYSEHKDEAMLFWRHELIEALVDAVCWLSFTDKLDEKFLNR